MPATLDDIEWAVEFASSGLGDHEAYIHLDTGEIVYIGDVVEEPVPDDFYDSDRYLMFPDKRDLDLGRSLALRFVEEFIPNKLNYAYDIFSRKGAYSKFRVLLETTGQLDKWYAFEQAELKTAIVKWCSDNNVEFDSGI
jgi:hypothetical protein